LEFKLKALDKFMDTSQMSQEVYDKIKTFITFNYNHFSQRLDIDKFMTHLPSTLKEELIYHKYGKRII
jgi:hypothetical protein